MTLGEFVKLLDSDQQIKVMNGVHEIFSGECKDIVGSKFNQCIITRLNSKYYYLNGETDSRMIVWIE